MRLLPTLRSRQETVAHLVAQVTELPIPVLSFTGGETQVAVDVLVREFRWIPALKNGAN